MGRITKKEIRKAIHNKLPHLSVFLLKNGGDDIFNMPNENANNLIGGLSIQLVKNTIWFRAYPPCSGGCLDSIDEMIDVIHKIMCDELIILVGYKAENWEETSLQFSNQEIEFKEGLTYDLLSWSGKYDRQSVKNIN